MTDPRYPIGKFQRTETVTDEERKKLIAHIAEAPGSLRSAVRGLSEPQLEIPYRDGGWTVKQIVHHLPDSHLNAYIRFKLGMTEHEPAIKTYHEELWAELHDARTAPIEISLVLLESLHSRWVAFMHSLRPTDFHRTLKHPEYGLMKLDDLLSLYSWHGRHHVAQITSFRERMRWT